MTHLYRIPTKLLLEGGKNVSEYVNKRIKWR